MSLIKRYIYMIPLMFVIIYNNIYNGSAYVFWYSAINVYMDISNSRGCYILFPSSCSIMSSIFCSYFCSILNPQRRNFIIFHFLKIVLKTASNYNKVNFVGATGKKFGQMVVKYLFYHWLIW